MIAALPARPIPYSYWVLPGRFLAGQYPGSLDPAEARSKVQQFLVAGVTLFLDLTGPDDGLEPYEAVLREEAAALKRAARRQHMPIPDFGVPTVEEMGRIQDTLDAALFAGHVVYLHCWGGIGRTGTVVGCYLVRHGMSGEAALREIARLRQVLPGPPGRSPETDVQREMIRSWADLPIR